MPEAILIAGLQRLIETDRRRGAALSPVEKYRLRCFEENLQVLLDQQTAKRIDNVLHRYRTAIFHATEAAADAKKFLNKVHAAQEQRRKLSPATSNDAIARSKALLAMRP